MELNHPKIIKLKDTFKDDSHIGLILDLAKGTGLSNVLQAHHRLPYELIWIIISQLVQIFDYLHSNGYVYKDLKASHIFLNKNGNITLIDLGMVEKLEILQRSYIPAGTFHSMAPEMIDIWESSIINDGKVDEEGLKGYNTNIDLYAIGVLIHELLFGKPPYGYLQATTDRDERLEYFEKTRDELSEENLKTLIEQKLGSTLNKKQDHLIDLMEQLLKKDEEERLGANREIDKIKQHEAIKDYNHEEEDKFLEDFVQKVISFLAI